MVQGFDDHRQVQFLGICFRKTSIDVCAPLHWSPHAVSVSQIEIVAHADFIPVVNYGGAWEREKENIHQFDFSSVVSEKRSEPVAGFPSSV